jgi:hypothetical protein
MHLLDTPKVPKYFTTQCFVYAGMPRLTLCGDVCVVTANFGLVPRSLGHASSSGTKESGIFDLFDVNASH